MATALQLIQAALEELGVYAPGETVNAADQDRCLWVLNAMLDSWSTDALACFAILEQTGLLVPGKQSYTIGAGGDFNVVRPIRLIDGPGAAFVTDSSGNRFPVDVVQRDRWNQIGNLSVTTQLPDTLFYDPQFPLGVINVYGVPSIGYTLSWDSYLQLTQFASLTQNVNLPPGYQDAYQHNLAVRLKPYFKSAQLDPSIVTLANETKANIKRSNIRPVEASVDAELVARASGSYNIYRDGRGSST